MSATAEEANFVLSLNNKLLNSKMKKFIRKSMPNVHELLSSKFLDSGKGSLKLKKKKQRKKSTKKRKKGGATFLFGPKKSKTLDDVGEKIDAGETLTKHDATILCRATDELAAKTLMNIIMANEEIPGAKDVIKIYNGFLESQKKALTIVEKKTNESRLLVKAELEEMEQSKMDKRVKEQAITIFENTTAQLGAVQKMVGKKAQNLENVNKRNEIIKTAAFFWFALMAIITIWCFLQFMYKLDSAMDKAQQWLSKYQYVCTSGPTFFERIAGVTGELRDCKEGLTWPIIGSIVNTISDGITSLALMGAGAVSMGRIIIFMYALLQFTAVPLFSGFTGYYGIMSRVREDDRAEMMGFKESLEAQNELIDQQQKSLRISKISVNQLATFVGTQSQNPTTPIVMDFNSRSSSRAPSLTSENRIEEIPDPIPEEGALRKTSRKSRARRSKGRVTRLASKRTRRPSRTRRR